MLSLLTVLALSQAPVACASGRGSHYEPGDGHNSGHLACGGRYTSVQVHIAYRRWWKVGCGRRVIVCSDETRLCHGATVQDAGPFGVYRHRLSNRRDATRREMLRGRPQAGWKWRGVADMSEALWRRLGRPRFLSTIHIFFLPRLTSKHAGSYRKSRI